MRIGIICAMKEEFELISKNIKVNDKITKAHLEFLIGEFEGKNIVGVICGIGKVNAAICTQILISKFECTHILNSGVAGGIKNGVDFKNVVIASDLIQHDVDVSNFGYKLGEVPNIGTHSFPCDENLINISKSACEEMLKNNNDFKFHIGRIATGDQFICDDKKSKNLCETFDALACEMESGSIAQTCYLNNIPFLIIRSISDNGGNIAGDEFYKFLEEASKNSYEIIRKIIKNMS